MRFWGGSTYMLTLKSRALSLPELEAVPYEELNDWIHEFTEEYCLGPNLKIKVKNELNEAIQAFYLEKQSAPLCMADLVKKIRIVLDATHQKIPIWYNIMAVYFTGKIKENRREAPLEIPPPRSAGLTDPSGYLADEGLVDAVNVAIVLGQPLLLTGEPGTGKTQTCLRNG